MQSSWVAGNTPSFVWLSESRISIAASLRKISLNRLGGFFADQCIDRRQD